MRNRAAVFYDAWVASRVDNTTEPAASFLADLVTEFPGDGLEGAFGQREPLALVRSGAEQVAQDV